MACDQHDAHGKAVNEARVEAEGRMAGQIEGLCVERVAEALLDILCSEKQMEPSRQETKKDYILTGETQNVYPSLFFVVLHCESYCFL